MHNILTPLDILESLGRGESPIGALIRDRRDDILAAVTDKAKEVLAGLPVSENAQKGSRYYLSMIGMI